MHSLTRSQWDSQPICPRMKQIQCLSKLVWVLQYCLERSCDRTLMDSWPFLFLIRYMILYLLKRGISSRRSSPKNPDYLNTSYNSLSARQSENSFSSQGAAGSLVQKQSLPYLAFRSMFLTFSTAISQVHLSSLHVEWMCFTYSSSSSGRKQLANASAASCRDKLFSFSSFTTAIRKSFSKGSLSSLSCPKVQSTSCDSKTDSERCGQDYTSLRMAESVLMFLSWKTAWQRRPISSWGLISWLQKSTYWSCIQQYYNIISFTLDNTGHKRSFSLLLLYFLVREGMAIDESLFLSVIIHNKNRQRMANKIALVNKQLHTRLFQTHEQPEQASERKMRKQQVPPHLLLKSMIKKGLTATSNSFLARPRTAQSNFKYSRANRQTLDKIKSIDTQQLQQKNRKKRYEMTAETPIDFQSSKPPKEFQEFDGILDKAVKDLRKQSQRKRVKLQKYSQKKFSYAWKKFNIPK